MESHRPYVWAPCPACWVCPVPPGPCGTAITTWGWGSRFAQTYQLGHISCANAALARGMGRGVNMGTHVVAGCIFPKLLSCFVDIGFIISWSPRSQEESAGHRASPLSPAQHAPPACAMGATRRQSHRKTFPDLDKLPLILSCFQLEAFACTFECKIFRHYFCETEFRIKYSLPKTSFFLRFEKNLIRLQFQTFSWPICFLLL